MGTGDDGREWPGPSVQSPSLPPGAPWQQPPGAAAPAQPTAEYQPGAAYQPPAQPGAAYQPPAYQPPAWHGGPPPQQPARRPVWPWLLGGCGVLALLGLGLVVVLTLVVGGLALGSAGPQSYGDDPYLDRLQDACAAGDGGACDDLYSESPFGSDYEDFGEDCGDRGVVTQCRGLDLDAPAG